MTAFPDDLSTAIRQRRRHAAARRVETRRGRGAVRAGYNTKDNFRSASRRGLSGKSGQGEGGRTSLSRTAAARAAPPAWSESDGKPSFRVGENPRSSPIL